MSYEKAKRMFADYEKLLAEDEAKLKTHIPDPAYHDDTFHTSWLTKFVFCLPLIVLVTGMIASLFGFEGFYNYLSQNKTVYIVSTLAPTWGMGILYLVYRLIKAIGYHKKRKPLLKMAQKKVDTFIQQQTKARDIDVELIRQVAKDTGPEVVEKVDWLRELHKNKLFPDLLVLRTYPGERSR